MKKINLTCCLLAAMLVTAMTQDAQAQRPAQYYPAKPTFSTYFLYRQLNGTGIPNYYSYVKPATQYRDFLTRAQPMREEARTTLSVEGEVSRILDSQLRQRSTTGIGQPAYPAQFGETSHFYPRTPVMRR